MEVEDNTCELRSDPLLTMTVEIGDGRQDVLLIHPTDAPGVLAAQFALKHNLSRALTKKLSILIAHNQAASARYQLNKSVRSLPKLEQTHYSEVNQSKVLGKNYGEMLYTQGMTRKKTARAKSETGFSFTFSPAINPQNRRRVKTENLLIKKGKERDEKVKYATSRMIQEEMGKCPFRPSVNSRSAKLDRMHKVQNPRHEVLYDIAKKQAEKQETALSEVPAGCTFRPETISARRRPETFEKMLDRLTNSKQAFQVQIEKAKMAQDLSVDSETGQPLFQPKTGRSPQSQRQPEQVFNRLYALRTRLQGPEDLSVSLQAPRNPFYSQLPAESKRLVHQYRSRQLEKLFRLLDQDRDGLINSSTAEVGGMSDRAFWMLEPIWTELGTSDNTLDQSGFEQRVEEVMSGLSIEEKDFLLREADRLRTEDLPLNLSVSQPQLCQLSISLAAGRYLDSDPYTRQVEEQRLTQERVKKLKQSLEARELAPCTFHPSTTKYVRR